MAAAGGDLSHEQIGQSLDLPPIRYGPGWLKVDFCLVELAEVQRLLVEALAPARVQIFPEVAGRQLVAYVAANVSLRIPEQAHARCLAALPGRHTAMAPRYYVLCEAAPADPADLAGWHAVVAEGSGRTIKVASDASDASLARQADPISGLPR